MSSTTKWMRFQPPGAGRAAVGHRPSGRARRPAEQQAQVAADDVGERRRGVRAQREAEVGGVEVDGGLDVVDHVADVHELVRHVRSPPGRWWSVRSPREEADAGRRARSAVRSNAGSVSSSLPGSRAGSGMLQWTSSGRAGELGADLAHAVAERDHVVEALPGELVQVLGAPASDVDAALAHHAHRVGMQRLGVAARADRAHRAAGQLLGSASAICERALLPVHRNSTRAGAAPARARRVGAASARGPDAATPPAPASSSPQRARSST